MSEHMMKEPLPQKSSHKPQQTTQAAETAPVTSPNEEMIRLQRLIGNQAVQRMLTTNPADIHQRTGLTVQTKMTVGAADDPYEREADAVASQVMAKRDVVQRESADEDVQMKRIDIVQRSEGGEAEEEELQMKRIDIVQRSEAAEEEGEELQMKRVDTIQRSEAAEEEGEELQMKRVNSIQRSEAAEEKGEELQMKRADIQAKKVDMSGSFDVEKDVESKISAKSGSGQTIPDVNREMFESSMGHDFSGVNVHADSESDSLNKQLGARAFTTGSDIFFRQGEYNPTSSGGQELLAHELTHVVQQGGAKVQKKSEEE